MHSHGHEVLGSNRWERASAGAFSPQFSEEADIYSDNTVYEELGRDRCLLSDMSLKAYMSYTCDRQPGFHRRKR